MSFSSANAALIAANFGSATDGPGVSATYTAKTDAANPVGCTAIVNELDRDRRHGMAAPELDVREAAIAVDQAEVPDANKGDQIAVGSTTWKVQRVRSRSHGVTVVECVAPAVSSVEREGYQR